MSVPKDIRCRLKPLIETVAGCLKLTSKEAQLEEQINRTIIEELLKSDELSKVSSCTRLKLIIYELILFYCQQLRPSSETG